MTTMTPPAAWNNSALEDDFIERDRLLALIEPPSREDDDLDPRHDFPSDLRRDQLRGVLDPLCLKLAAVEKRIVTGEALERAVNELVPAYRAGRASLVAGIEPLMEQSTVDPSVIRLIAARSRQLSNLRHALYNVTGLPEFAKDWSPIEDLRE